MPRLQRFKPESLEHRAMMIRHRLAIDAIQANPEMVDTDRYEWLLAVVAPGPELLAVSLNAAKEAQTP